MAAEYYDDVPPGPIIEDDDWDVRASRGPIAIRFVVGEPVQVNLDDKWMPGFIKKIPSVSFDSDNVKHQKGYVVNCIDSNNIVQDVEIPYGEELYFLRRTKPPDEPLDAVAGPDRGAKTNPYVIKGHRRQQS